MASQQRRWFASLLALGCVSAPLGLAHAADAVKDFPKHPLMLVVPNAPGGAVDILARLLAEPLQADLGQPVVVVYKPGAGTVVGTDYVARSAPDGHTLGMVVTSHMINPALRTDLPYDTQRDLAGVALLATSDVVITASPSLGAKTLAEVVEMARADPKRISYASPGSGSAMHLAGEQLKVMTGTEMMHVPFRGAGPAYPEVMAGRVSLLIDPLFSSLPHIEGGRLMALAVTGPTRAKALPDVPTVAEQVPGFEVSSLFGVVVPAATPDALRTRLSEAFGRALAREDIQQRMAELGLTPAGTTPAEFDARIDAEMKRWADVVTRSGASND